jgi:hypothetical protein
VNFRLKKSGNDISIITHDAPVGKSERFAEISLVISCQYQEFSPYTPGYVILSHTFRMRTSKSDNKIYQYSMEWHSGNEPFSRAREDLLRIIKKSFGSIPEGFAGIVDEFLSIIHEDRRRGELKEHIRFMLNISDQKEIEGMVRMEVAEQIIKS